MGIKSFLTSQEDFTGEYKKTNKTFARWKFNENDSDMKDDIVIEAQERESVEVTGFPRYPIDGIDESKTYYKRYFDGTDADLTLNDNAQFISSGAKFRNICLDFSNGGSADTSTICPSDGGDSRSVCFWFKCSSSDLDGTNWHSIITQRKTSNHGYHFAIYNNGLIARAYTSTGGYAINTNSYNSPLEAGVWYFVALTHNATNYQLHINKRVMESGTVNGIPDYSVDSFSFGLLNGLYQYYGAINGLFIYPEYWENNFNFYNNYNITRILPDSMSIETQGLWSVSDFDINDSNGYSLISNEENATFSLNFNGSGLKWITRKGNNLGIAKILIDNIDYGNINLYNSTTEYKQTVYENLNIGSGQHTVTIQVTNTSNNNSSDTTIYHDMFEISQEDNIILDDTGNNIILYLRNFSSTGTSFKGERLGNAIDLNPNTNDNSYLYNDNLDGNLLIDLGIVNINFSITPKSLNGEILNTESGEDDPVFNIYIDSGKIGVKLFDNSGTSIFDNTFDEVLTEDLEYWINIIISIDMVYIGVGDVSTSSYTSSEFSYTGTLNSESKNRLLIGTDLTTYFIGRLNDFVIEKNSDWTIDGLKNEFFKSITANGGSFLSNVDGITSSGSVLLKKENDVFVSSGILYTRILDIGENGFSGDSKIKLDYNYSFGITSIENIQTRSSLDLENPLWSEWQDVDLNGFIESPNRQYLQIRLNLLTNDNQETPSLNAIHVIEVAKAPYSTLSYAKPVILNQDEIREAVIDTAFDINVVEELNGANYITFRMIYDNFKRPFIENEKLILLTDIIYRIRTLTDDRTADGKIITTVYAEALFYDLAFSEPVEEISFIQETAQNVLIHGLKNSGWTLETTNVTSLRDWDSKENNILSYLRKVQELFGGDLIFNSIEKTVSLLEKSGSNNGLLFAYKKNMKNITRTNDTRELITKLYLKGANDLTIADANDGIDYLENYSYTELVRITTLTNTSFTNPYHLKEWGEYKLNILCIPKTSYVMEVMDLSVLTGWEYDDFSVGDTVTVYDTVMNIQIETRIVRYEYNAQEPHKSVVELSTILKELGDEASRWQQSSNTLEDTNSVDTQQIENMMTFNYLLNSRADDNFSYWTNYGFTIDNESGVSSSNSFKCVGAIGVNKSLLQTIYPSNRDNYTLSAQISTENIVKNDNSKLGIEITIHYKDGTSETKFITL